MTGPLTTNDGVVFGFLCLILAFVFQTARSQNPFFRRFYGIVPPLLICYFVPSLLTSLGIYDPEKSNIYYVASRFLLPASLVLLTVGTDLKEILRLGPKAITVFLAGTIGVVIGGPVSLYLMQIFWPSAVAGFGDQEIWRGMATVAGSWIGGGANQTAMKEVFEVQEEMFSAMITVDVLVANVWMAFLLFGVPRAEKIDRWNGADASMIAGLKEKLVLRQEGKERIPQVADLFLLLAIGFGVTAVAHFFADLIAPWISTHAPGLARFSLTSPFFWLVVIATAGGIILSMTKASQLESVGASKLGTVFLYLLIASIGMKMDVVAIFEHMGLFVMGMIWILIHGLVLFTVAWIVKAPFFLVAVGSQANIGGAASAPVVAGAFHPSLAPIGVLLAVLGYGVGTYAAYFCAQLMRVLSGG
jgi:uncharacterized membrane protein